MIPRLIHYIWIGGNPLPKLALDCIQSWNEKCPDYKIKLWNEENLNIEECLFTKQAYENKKYGFVTDYLRLKIIFENGGIYLDTDVEVLKSLDELLSLNAFFGFENDEHINTGAGFGAVKGCNILKDMMEQYEKTPFIKADGSFDMTACPQRDTVVLRKIGLKLGTTIQEIDGIQFFPSEYFSPINYTTGIRKVTDKTFSIHHFMASWKDEKEVKQNKTRHILVKVFGEKVGLKFNNIFIALSEKSFSEFSSYIFSKVTK
jgi:mannosyltransferase OCH1-like enzyme